MVEKISGFNWKRVGVLLVSVLVGYFVNVLLAVMFANSGLTGVGWILGFISAIAVYRRLTKRLN